LEPWQPSRRDGPDGQIALGHPLVDEYLELVRARWRRNTLLATAFDLKVFFSTVRKEPTDVITADVLAFLRAQRRGPGKVVRISDGSSGMALSTVQRRLSSLSCFYAYLVATDRLSRSPMLRGLATRASVKRGRRGSALVRPARPLPKVLEPADVVALLTALRKWRDRAMVEAMVLGGLRRAEGARAPPWDQLPGL